MYPQVIIKKIILINIYTFTRHIIQPLKKNEILSSVTTLMDIKDIMLSEMSYRQRKTKTILSVSCMINILLKTKN